MKLVPLNIPPGVVRGATPYDVPGRWYDANLVRWRQGIVEPIGGWTLQGAAALPFPDRIRRIFRWRDNGNFLRTVVFTDTTMYTYSGSDYIDITPSGPFTGEFTTEYENQTIAPFSSAGSLPVGYGVGAYGGEAYGTARSEPSELLAVVVPVWAYDNWGEDMVAVASPDGHLIYWDVSSPSDPAIIVATASEGHRFVFVTEERHCVLLQYGGNPRRLAWSSREDYTDWDFASTTNTAGFLELESSTPLNVAAHCRNGDLIFTETEVFNMRYVGQPFVYGVQRLEETRLLGPRMLATDSGVCFWMSRDGFYKSDGAQVQPVQCPVWEYILSILDGSAITSLGFASQHGQLPEIWWFFPSSGSTVADKYVVYNWVENWWTIGSLTRAAMAPAIASSKPMMAGTDGNLYDHENGWTNAGLSREGTVYLESGVVRVPPAGDNLMEINQAMLANGFTYDTLRLTFYGKQTPHGSERTFGPYTPRSDGYIDTRVTARDLRMRVEALGDSDWNVGEARLAVGTGSKR